MDFHWEISSRTGEQYQGTDEFPNQDVKDSANLFKLSLSYPCAIQAPYGQDIFGTELEIAIPDDCRLVFKRRVRMEMCGTVERSRTYIYIIAFEKVS